MCSDPEEGTTREEVKELTLNCEDLEALKEMASFQASFGGYQGYVTKEEQ